MKLVPIKREKLLTTLNIAKIPSKKVKVQVEARQTFPFCCNLAEKLKVGQALSLTWTFTFLVVIFATFRELRCFLTNGWDQFHT